MKIEFKTPNNKITVGDWTQQIIEYIDTYNGQVRVPIHLEDNGNKTGTQIGNAIMAYDSLKIFIESKYQEYNNSNLYFCGAFTDATQFYILLLVE